MGRHRGFWYAYDPPDALGTGKVQWMHGGMAAGVLLTAEGLRADLQLEEDKRARRARKPENQVARVVRVWPVASRDFTSERPRGLQRHEAVR